MWVKAQGKLINLEEVSMIATYIDNATNDAMISFVKYSTEVSKPNVITRLKFRDTASQNKAYQALIKLLSKSAAFQDIDAVTNPNAKSDDE